MIESTYSCSSLVGVGVVEPQVELAAVLLGEAEIQADALRVADVQIPIRLGRKPRVHAPARSSRREIGLDDLLDEVARFGFLFCLYIVGSHIVPVREVNACESLKRGNLPHFETGNTPAGSLSVQPFRQSLLIWKQLEQVWYIDGMDTSIQTQLTPDQLAAIHAGGGFAVEDPQTLPSLLSHRTSRASNSRRRLCARKDRRGLCRRRICTAGHGSD